MRESFSDKFILYGDFPGRAHKLLAVEIADGGPPDHHESALQTSLYSALQPRATSEPQGAAAMSFKYRVTCSGGPTRWISHLNINYRVSFTNRPLNPLCFRGLTR